MKVLFVSRGLPDNRYPLNGVFELDQAKALAARGIEVVYFAVDIRSFRRKRKWGISEEDREGVRCFTISIPVGAVPYKIAAFAAGTALKVLYRRVFKEEAKPDVIHAHFTFQGYIAGKLAEKEAIPLVITEHSSTINREVIKKQEYQMAEKAYKKADCVIAVSHALAEKINTHFSVQCKVIPNIVDTHLFMYQKEK